MGLVPGGILFNPLDCSGASTKLLQFRIIHGHDNCMSRTSRSDIRAVTLLIFLSRSAGTGIVASHFCGGANGLWRFGLCRAGLVLQVALLPGLLAFDFARYRRQMLRR